MSDSETTDSDSGIRFKTTSTRYKEGADKYSSSSKSKRSVESNRRRSRDRDRDRDRRRDRGRSSNEPRRSKRSYSRSSSRSRSRERRKRTEKRRKNRRSRSRSKAKKNSHEKREREPTPENRRSTSTTVTSTNKDTNSTEEHSKIEPAKILDISVSSLSSQDDHIGKEDVPEDYFGPALPPTLQSQTKEGTTNESPSGEEKTDVIGPALPPQLVIPKQDDLQTVDAPRVIGPTLPSGFKPATDVNESSESELSPFSEEEPAEEEEDFVGPMPGASSSRSHLELEQRALELKLRRFDGDHYETNSANATSREDWMLELPDIRKVSDMGLGARQFRTREKLEIGDRSVWTDTPSDRERKKAGGHSSKDPSHDREAEQERRRVAERDKEQEELIKRHKKKHKREKSLLDIHQKKVKKEKKKQDKSSEPTRRPFDRNVDLHANRFDEAQKKAIYKKAQLLDTRFSSGASKFL